MSDRAKQSTRMRECAIRINNEVKFLIKNVPVSGRNAEEQLLIAWELENAARAIKQRVSKKRGSQNDSA